MQADVEHLFHQALLLPSTKRKAFLREHTGGDRSARVTLERLLGAYGEAVDFLEHPVVRQGIIEKGSRVGAYVLEEVIGEGGMATVYRGRREDGEFEHKVAIKVIQRGLVPADLIRRFRRERQILAGLDHPGIARLLDGGSDPGGTPFFVMELVDGEPIDRYCDRRRLSIPARLRLFLRVCDAVSYAHRNLVIHRDLKPGNILVKRDGSPKLIDFGISTILKPVPSDDLAQDPPAKPTLPFLTLGWASPEQLRGGAITTASDIYSLGRILAFLLSGQAPPTLLPGDPLDAPMATPWKPEPEASNQEASEARGLYSRALRRELQGDLRDICLKALRIEAPARYPFVDALAADVAAYLEGRPVAARNGSARYRAAKFFRRHRLILATSAAAGVLLLGAAGVAVQQGREALRQERAAELERLRTTQVNTFLIEVFDRTDPNATANDVTAGEMLERASERLREAFPDQPNLRLSLALTLGEIYGQLGESDRALSLFEGAAQDLRPSESADPRLSIRTLLGLAQARLQRAQLEAAESSARAAWVTAQARLAPADPLALEASIALSRVLIAQHQPAEAFELARRAMLDLPGVGGDYEILGGRLLWTQARAAFWQGKRDLAFGLARRSLPMFRHRLGPDHPETLGVLHSFASILEGLGRHEEADKLYWEVFEARRRRLGDHHPAVAFSLQVLGSHAEQKGDMAAARDFQERALAIRQEVLGPHHHLTLDSQLRVANLAWRRRELRPAEVSARQALRILQRDLPDNHPLAAFPLLVLGRVLTDTGDLLTAEGYLSEAVEIFDRSDTNGFSAYAAQASCRLALCLHRQGRAEEAHALAQTTCRQLSERFNGIAAQDADRVLGELGLDVSAADGRQASLSVSP